VCVIFLREWGRDGGIFGSGGLPIGLVDNGVGGRIQGRRGTPIIHIRFRLWSDEVD
jgi:hypothetical protein